MALGQISHMRAGPRDVRLFRLPVSRGRSPLRRTRLETASFGKALSAARRFVDTWETTYPKAVACPRSDLDNLLTCFRCSTITERKRVRTTNAVERRFLEVRRRSRRMGTLWHLLTHNA